MAEIINDAAEVGLMLPKNLGMLYENIREFQIAIDDENRVLGVCGLSIIWAGLAEIVSLVVREDQRGKGLGKKLAQACLDEAEQLGIRKIMTLTYEQAFFERLGFHVVDRQQLPLKVWQDCIRCPKNQACDEIAMIRILEHIPEPQAPVPPSPGAASYIVPVIRKSDSQSN